MSYLRSIYCIIQNSQFPCFHPFQTFKLSSRFGFRVLGFQKNFELFTVYAVTTPRSGSGAAASLHLESILIYVLMIYCTIQYIDAQ
jgi:hypothetical protein